MSVPPQKPGPEKLGRETSDPEASISRPADRSKTGSRSKTADESEGAKTASAGWGRDLQDARWIYAKGLLFLFTGLLAAGLLIAEHPSWKVTFLLVLAIWCCARFYYFAFYVIEHYVDGQYKFDGLYAFVLYLLRRPRG